MTQFIKRLVIFIGVFALVYVPFFFFVLPVLLTKYNGPSTEQQIEQSFRNANARDFEMVVLGNSRMYRGINPDMFDIPTFNFSHDNDNYNQLFYKLKYLIDHDKNIKSIILGLDFFQFSFISDSRNYAYLKFFDDAYLHDYPPKKYLLLYNLRKFKPVKLKGLDLFRKKKPFVKENGQYVSISIIATPNDYVKRDVRRKKIQVNYFERILNLCAENEITVFLVMMPTRENELRGYTSEEIEEFYQFISKHTSDHVILLDFTYDSTYTIKDFADITHLTPEGADRFSKQLNDTLLSYVRVVAHSNGLLGIKEEPE